MKNIPCIQKLSLCGLAKVDLSELLDGLTMAELSLPVLSGSHLNNNDGKQIHSSIITLNSCCLPGLVLVGGYLHHHTQLAVTIQVSHPLLFTRLSASPTSRPLVSVYMLRVAIIIMCSFLPSVRLVG